MAETDGGAKPAIDVKVWIAAALFVFGFLSGLGVANGRSAGAVLSMTKEVVSAHQTIVSLRDIRDSSRNFIVKVKEQDQGAFDKARDGLAAEDRTNVDLLAK